MTTKTIIYPAEYEPECIVVPPTTPSLESLANRHVLASDPVGILMKYEQEKTN